MRREILAFRFLIIAIALCPVVRMASTEHGEAPQGLSREERLRQYLAKRKRSVESDVQSNNVILALPAPSFKAPIFACRGSITFLESSEQQQSIGTGAIAWDGAFALANWLQRQVDGGQMSLNGLNVMELGAGCSGLVSICAARLGARQVIATDIPSVVPLLRANLQQNIHSDSPNQVNWEAAALDWIQVSNMLNAPADQAHQTTLSELVPWNPDLILCADVVWVSDLVPPLADTIDHLVPSGSPVVVYMAIYERSRVVEDKFFALLRAKGFEVELVETSASSERMRIFRFSKTPKKT